LIKFKTLIMSVFRSVPGVPLIKMERFAGVIQKLALRLTQPSPKKRGQKKREVQVLSFGEDYS
jgi:hypothetical protein